MEFREFTEYKDPLSQDYDIWSGLHAGGNNDPNSGETIVFEEDSITTLEEEPFIEIPEESDEESFEHTSGGSHCK